MSGEPLESALTEPLRRIEACLTSAGFGVLVVADGASILVPCEALGLPAAVRITAGGGLCHFELVLPIEVPAEHRASAALAVCGIDYGLPLGGFRFDPDTGQMSFYVSLPNDPVAGEPAIWARIVTTCVRTVEEQWESLVHLWDAGGHDLSGVIAASAKGHRFPPQASPSRTPGDDQDPSAWIQDRESDRVRALLVRGPEPETWSIQPVLRGEVAEEEEIDAIEWLKTQPTTLVAVLSSDHRVPSLETSIEKLGFVRERVEIVVERSLLSRLPPPEANLTARSPADYPEEMIELALSGTASRGLVGRPAKTLLHPRAEWTIWELEGEPVGVALWSRLPDGEVGVVDFLGVLPSWRGRGHGRALHAATLRNLAALGCRTYRDNTDVENVAMQRVFFRNGCQLRSHLVYFELANA